MKPHTVDTTAMTDEERQNILASAVYSGYDVLDDPIEGVMIITKAKPMIRRKPKRRFI